MPHTRSGDHAPLPDLPSRNELLARPGVPEALQRALFRESPVPTALLRTNGSVLDVNEAFCTRLGHPRSELLERPLDRYTLPDDLDGEQAEFARLTSGEISRFSMFKRYLTRSDQVIAVDLTVQRVDGADDVFEVAVIHAQPVQVSPEFLRLTTTKDGRPAFRASFRLRDVFEDWFRSVGVSNRIGYAAVWSAVSSAVLYVVGVSGSAVSGYLSHRDELARTRVLLETKAATIEELQADLKTTLANQRKGEEDRRQLTAQVDALLKLSRRIETKMSPAKD